MSIDKFSSRIEFSAMTHFVRDLEDEGRSPVFRTMESATTDHVVVSGRSRIMLGSNNYLGLANHPRVIDAAQAALRRFGAASTGSRVANGTCSLHRTLEDELAQWHNTESAVLFPTGYQANVGTISALVRPGDTVILDWAAHASIHDGARLAGAHIEHFNQNSADELRALLVGARAVPTLVVVDGLYSMEGDIAPLDEIAALCREFSAMLMVDEAHSVGILGATRTGAVELFGMQDDVDIRMGTLSKGLGSIGGYVVGPEDLTDYLRTHARAYQFTTAGTPAAVGAAVEAVRIAQSDEGAERTARLIANVDLLRGALAAHDVETIAPTVLPDGTSAPGPIVPAIVADEQTLIEVWNRLFDQGIFSGISVFPGVRIGNPLLRLCVTADHSIADLEFVAKSIASLRPAESIDAPALTH